jgi:hypothetical protein
LERADFLNWVELSIDRDVNVEKSAFPSRDADNKTWDHGMLIFGQNRPHHVHDSGLRNAYFARARIFDSTACMEFEPLWRPKLSFLMVEIGA